MKARKKNTSTGSSGLGQRGVKGSKKKQSTRQAKKAGASKKAASLPAAPAFWYSDLPLTLEELVRWAANNDRIIKPMTKAKAVAAAKRIGLLTPSGKLGSRYKRHDHEG